MLRQIFVRKGLILPCQLSGRNENRRSSTTVQITATSVGAGGVYIDEPEIHAARTCATPGREATALHQLAVFPGNRAIS